MMSSREDYRQWPFLTDEEFELACAFFDRRYVQAKLGVMRRLLKVRPRRAATTGSPYLEIVRLLQLRDDADNLSVAFEKLCGGEQLVEELEVEGMDEDADHEELRSESSKHEVLRSSYGVQPQSYVKYEIHLHQTYNVPVLWFSLHNLPVDDPAFDIESVYRYLVPAQYKSNMRSIGIVGGISAAPHPITDVPAFFIHPCQTSEALENFNCSIDKYIMIWLGLVGPPLGLWLPSEMAG